MKRIIGLFFLAIFYFSCNRRTKSVVQFRGHLTTMLPYYLSVEDTADIKMKFDSTKIKVTALSKQEILFRILQTANFDGGEILIENTKSGETTAFSFYSKNPKISLTVGGIRSGSTVTLNELKGKNIWGRLENYNVNVNFPVVSLDFVYIDNHKLNVLSCNKECGRKGVKSILDNITKPTTLIIRNIIVDVEGENMEAPPFVLHII